MIISFRDLMKQLWAGDTVDLTVVTFSAARKEGGAIKEYKGIRLNMKKERENRITAGSTKDDIQLMPSVFYRPKPTINIILPNNDVRTIYKVGIIRANNQTVAI